MSRPPRVLMVTTEWPRDTWGGTATFVQRQAEFLRAAGVDVEVFEFVGAKNPARYVRAWREVRRRVQRGDHDLIHAQFGQSGLVALPKPRPLVVTFRGDDLEGVLDDSSGRLTSIGRLLPHLSRLVARHADAVIVVSAHLKRALGAGVAARAHVIPSGLDFERFAPRPRDAARQRLRLPLDRALVLFVGSPTLARKRYDLARAAVERLRGRLPVELILGWSIPHLDVPLYMSACDALVFTSRQEGSPNVVKEALACDLPVVSVAVGDVAERLTGVDGCELCHDERPEAIAAALERVLRRGTRVRGREAVAHLDERVLTQRVIDIYRGVVAGREAVAQPVAAGAVGE